MIFSRSIYGKSYTMSKGCCGIFSSHHIKLVFFFLFFPWGRNFWRFCSLRHWTLHWKEAELILQKAVGHKVSWGQQCFVWCEIITKLDNINTIMLWSLPVILVNFSFFSPYCGIFLSHHIRPIFFPFLPWRRNILRFWFVCHWVRLNWPKAELMLLKAANHKFLGVTRCLIWCEVITKTIVIFTIMLSSFPVIFIKFQFFLSWRKHNLKVVFRLFGAISKEKSYLSRVFEAKRKHRASQGRQLYQYQSFSKFTQKIRA